MGARRRTLKQAGFLGENVKLFRCRWCGNEIPKNSRRRTFCSDKCVHEYKIRSNYNYAREKVYERDRGVCAQCGLDTDRFKEELKTQAELMAKKSGRSALIILKELARENGMPGPERTWWEADHIVAIAEGGGLGGLDSYQTLCYKCHQQKTIEMRHRLKGTGNKFVERDKEGADVVYDEFLGLPDDSE
jgi:5-methylcytosine-specific restriction endonuclease McrA